MVYFHGGGGYYFSPELESPICARYAVEADVDILAVKYGLAPENKAPQGIYDGYACVKDIVENAAKYGLDKNNIGMMG